MNTLINNLLLFDRLNEQQVKLIRDVTLQVHLHKGEYFVEPGNTLSQLAFVDAGVLRYNYYNSKGENITSGLIGEDSFVAAANYLHLHLIQSDYLQAITECTLSIIGESGMMELSATVSNWDSMVKRILQKAIADRRSRIIGLFENMDPEVLADQYLQKFPNVSKHLNVTQMLQYINVPVNGQEAI